MSNPISGFGYLFRGISLIIQPGVKRFVIIPLLINVLLFVGLFWTLGSYVSDFIDYLLPSLPGWLSWLQHLLWLIFAILAGLIMFFTFTFVANLIGSPFNSFLSAAVEKHLTQQNPPGSDRKLLAEIGTMILSELKKWGYFGLWALLLLILTFIPVINIFSPVFWFIFGAWMLSVEYLDYPMGNHGLTFSEVRKEIANQRLNSLSFGSAVTIATLIPIVNFVVMPIAVAGATAMRVERYPLNKQIEQTS